MKPGNWLRVEKEERGMYGDNLIRINRITHSGDKADITYFYDWEDEKFLFKDPRRDANRWVDEMNFYKEYTPKELIASIFEDPIKGSF